MRTLLRLNATLIDVGVAAVDVAGAVVAGGLRRLAAIGERGAEGGERAERDKSEPAPRA